MKKWIQAFRLRTLPLSFSNILLGNALAYLIWENGEYPGKFSWLILALTLVTTLLLQILSNLANDYGDAVKGADNENRIGPKRAVQSGAISKQAMFRAIVICSILAFLSGILLLVVAFGSSMNYTLLLFLLLGVAAIAAAIKYTVGKGAYGYSGLGDIFVFIFFGLVGVLGSFYLQTKIFSWEFLLPAITAGCFSTAVLNLNNMRDRANDQAVGKNTLAVKLGQKSAKIYHGLLFVIAYAVFPLPLIFVFHDWILGILLLPVVLIHAFHLWKVYRICDPKEFDPELKKVALSALLFSIVFWISVIIRQNY